MSEDALTRCPHCDAERGIATFSTAPYQALCPNSECPIVSWRTDRTEGTP